MTRTLSHRPPASAGLAGLLTGPLGQAGGACVVDGLPDAATVHALLREAHHAYPAASRQVLMSGDRATGRGGTPERALRTAGGGSVQDALYAAPGLHASLSDLCGATVGPSGGRGSYSYYVEAGDFLGLHLDVETCDVTLITVLSDDTDPCGPGGGLAIYPHRFGAALDPIRRRPEDGVQLLRARPGQSVVLLGGLVPHCVAPLPDTGQRIISALCFTAAQPPM